MKKKTLVIIIVILLVIIIIAGVVIGLLLGKDKSVGTSWGDTYYAYLKEAINNDDVKEAEEKFGMQLDMKDTKINFYEVEENEAPSMIMTYSKNESNYVNVYQITENNKVTYVSYKQPTEVEYLYNIEKEEYSWYVHENSGGNDSYSSLKNVVSNLKQNSTKSEESEDINIAELEADYTISKENTETTVTREDGNTITISKFDEVFVRPEVETNNGIDFSVDIKEKELKKAVTDAVKEYKKNEDIMTDEQKEEVIKKVEEIKNTLEEIESEKQKAEMKITQENVASRLANQLKYFSALYLGPIDGIDLLYETEEQPFETKIPGIPADMYPAYEVKGISTKKDIMDDIKEYVTEEVITKRENGFNSITDKLYEYNNKVYLAVGGIGGGCITNYNTPKLISSEGDTTKVELEVEVSPGDYISEKIIVTVKYNTELSKFMVTDYDVQYLTGPNATQNSTTTNSNQNSTSQNINTQNNASSNTGSSNSQSTNTNTVTPSITVDQAYDLIYKKLGIKKPDESGFIENLNGIIVNGGYTGRTQKDSKGMDYYEFEYRAKSDVSNSHIQTIYVSVDGKKYKMNYSGNFGGIANGADEEGEF